MANFGSHLGFMVNNVFSFLLRCYIYISINNLAEINHIKSSNVPITQPHILMKSIQKAAILDFAKWKNTLRVTKRHPLNYWSEHLWDSKKPIKYCITLNTAFSQNMPFDCQDWFGGHLGFGEIIDHILS